MKHSKVEISYNIIASIRIFEVALRAGLTVAILHVYRILPFPQTSLLLQIYY